ncbi:MAG TPA: hypothetical protein VMT73_04405 [Anaerolineales bacterium]|nr:hypothetical protein [Anaerolineales bacterium]
MTTQNEDQDVSQSQYFDPFPEPQTIPAGWDVSGFLSAPQDVSDLTESNSAES